MSRASNEVWKVAEDLRSDFSRRRITWSWKSSLDVLGSAHTENCLHLRVRLLDWLWRKRLEQKQHSNAL